MKKLIAVCQALVIAVVISSLAFAGQIIQYNEAMVGANHPTLSDTLNRALLIQHNDNGVHTAVPWSAVDNTPTTLSGYGITDGASSFTTFPYDNLTGVPTTFPADNLTGTVAVAKGGTGSDNAAGARTNLGLDNASNYPTFNQPTTGNAATATALAADPTDCTPGDYATSIAANGNLTCGTPAGGGDMLAATYDANSDNVVDSAAALSAAYVDWNSGSGGASIQNKPTLGSMASMDNGTMTDTYLCIYLTGSNGIVCNTASNYYLATNGDGSSLTNLALSQVGDAGGLAALDNGTLTNTYVCTWVAGTGLVCNTDPATLGGDNLGSAAASDVVSLFSGSGDYLKTDGTQGTPAGAGTVNGPATVTTDNLVCWATDNVTIKDCGSAASAFAPASSTSTATDWNKWDGGATGLTAATGRTSLGLGGMAVLDNGTLTDTKYCIYTVGVGIVCNSEGGAGLSDNSVTSAYILDNAVKNIDIASDAAIDATKIADGTVTSAEFQYLGDVTSALQSQLNAKAPLVSPSFTTPTLGVASATSINTGQGANSLYQMDQNVRTTDNVVFASVTTDEWVTTCIASDNACGIGLGNQADPAGANLEASQLWFNTTSNMVKVRNGDNTATLEVMTSGAAHTLNFATSGTLTGGIMILDNVVSPTAAQCYGSWNTITTAGTVTLPAAATGMSTCIATEGALEITLELDGSDTFVLAGVTMSAGEAIINTTAEAAGDYICVIATSAVKWRVAGKQGTWTQATP